MKKLIAFLILVTMTAMLISGCTSTGFAKGGKPGAPTPQCNDNTDNDGDGYCDYDGCTIRIDKVKTPFPPDPDCDSADDNNEATECTPSTEVCDGIDNDCDSLVDEGLGSTTCGIGSCEVTVANCENENPQTCSPGSPSEEVCDGLDNDCDSTLDEDLSEQCGVSNVGECEYGISTCAAGAWGNCAGNVDPTTEICDALDNDCDGVVDDGCNCVHGATQACGSDVGLCEKGLQTCSSGAWGACVGETGPSTEVCDSLDNDCDSLVDENSVCVSCSDSDGGFVPQVFGTVSVTYDGGSPTTYDDFCMDNYVLIESYCMGSNAFFANYSCHNNGTTCSAGACI